MTQMISLSHWGLFEVPWPILLLPCTDEEFDLSPGRIYRIKPGTFPPTVPQPYGISPALIEMRALGLLN